ncbi:MAG: DUF3786 domain-containing protein [Candidatus Electrothrix sp. MAN1_4]|nr:DUF3786 domain-containing protein [Candidatus Electrothrix sp. MAN1_4]
MISQLRSNQIIYYRGRKRNLSDFFNVTCKGTTRKVRVRGGEEFWIDEQGMMSSECHINNWVYGPVLKYLVSSSTEEEAGVWIPFRDIAGAKEWENFFSHRCEQEMCRLADTHNALFFELLELFEAKELRGTNSADRSLLLYPLPGIPFLISYWEPEEPFESKLNIFFDTAASKNIEPEVFYALGRGMVEMFRKLIVQHSKNGKLF